MRSPGLLPHRHGELHELLRVYEQIHLKELLAVVRRLFRGRLVVLGLGRRALVVLKRRYGPVGVDELRLKTKDDETLYSIALPRQLRAVRTRDSPP